MKGYTLAELKKKYAEMSKKKGYRGWYEATKENAGNVPLNNAIFNMAMGSAKSVNMAQVNADNFIGDVPATADGGVGMVGMAESMKMQESVNVEKLTSAIKSLGSLSILTAEDWIALRDDPKLDKAKDDLWMYGNEVQALMSFVLDLNEAEAILDNRRGVIGVGVQQTLKKLKDMESDYPEDFNEGFNGDEHALIEKISALKDGEILRLKNFHNDASLEEPLDMCIKKNSKFPGRYILWNEGKNSGEKLNIINFSSLNNAVEWAKQTDEFLTESKRK